MGWSRHTIEPSRPSSKHICRRRIFSPSLLRLFGAIGFSLGGLTAFYGVTGLLGVDREFMRTEAAWGFKEIISLSLGVLAGVLGGFTGFSLAAGIEIRSEKTNHVLAVLWHYFANGLLVWLVLMSLVLTKALGQESAMQLFARLGVWYSIWAVVGPGALAGMAIAGALLVTGQHGFKTKPRFFYCYLTSLPISAAMAHSQLRLLGVPTDYWWALALMFPLALIPISVVLVARDMRQRRDLQLTTRK